MPDPSQEVATTSRYGWPRPEFFYYPTRGLPKSSGPTEGLMMDSVSLTSLAAEQLTAARQEAHSGRASLTLHGGHTHELRQTVVALLAGHELSEHDSPGQASLQVLQGHVHLTAGEDMWDGKTGDYVVIPPQRHSLQAVDDSVVMLTVFKSLPSA
jgi:quercetin dioxygenase-like cupin family protein